MASHIALRIALFCGMVAFGWVLLSSAPPPEQSPGRSPRMPDHPDALLQWLDDGHGDRDASAWRHAGEIFHWRGEDDAARQAWRRAARLARSSDSRRWAEYTRAWSLARLGEPASTAEAQRTVERMRQRESDEPPSYRSALSRALLLRIAGETRQAAEELELARLRHRAVGDPDSSESLYGLARIEAMSGRPDMAMAALQRAVEADRRIRRIGRARWAPEFGDLRNDPDFQRAIDRLAGDEVGGGHTPP